VNLPESDSVALIAGPAAAAEWDRYVDSAPQATAYHRHAWRDVVRSVFGHESYYLAARDAAGAIDGVLPLVRLKSLMFGDFMVSLPYFNYGGVLAESPSVRQRLLEAAAALGQRLGVSHLELRHRSDESNAWPERTDKVTMLLRLPATSEALAKSLTSKLRSQIKRPLREGAVCVFGREELLDEFYAVFAENMRDLGTPVYPKRFFATMLASIGETTLAVVRLAGQPVAAAFLVEFRQTMEIPWASSLRRVNNVGVNMCLYWNVLEHAVSKGCTVFDFGRSTLDSGTFRFKQQWGAEPLQLHWHYWLRDGGEPPKINPANPKYRAAVAMWRRLPLGIANWIGPHLVRNLP
jgi:serine/alanine adding enzyme